MWEEADHGLVSTHSDEHMQQAAYVPHTGCVLCCAGKGCVSEKRCKRLHDALKVPI